MAHTYGGVLLSRASSAGNPITVSLTVTAGVTVVALLLDVIGASARAGGAPTWGGYTFAQASSAQFAAVSPEAGAELWYLLNPLPGTYTLTIPNTGALTVWRQVIGGNAAAGGHSAFMAAAGGNNTATNPTPGAVTITAAGAFVVAVTAGGWQTWSPSAQVGTAITNSDDGAFGYGSQYALNPALGSYTLSWTFGTSDDWGAVVAAFAEVAPPNQNNYFRVASVSAGVTVTGMG